MTKRALYYIAGFVVICAVLLAVLMLEIPILFHHKLPYVSFFARSFFVLLIAGGMVLYRVMRGPTAADRIVAIDIFGILIVGFCAIIGIPTGRLWYIDIGIAWTLQSFISTLALSKYLEGKDLDE